MVFPPLPDIFLEVHGKVLLSDATYHGHEFVYRLVNDGTHVFILLGKLKDIDEHGQAYWIVVDVLKLPELHRAEFFLPEGCKTGQGSDIDDEIVAVIFIDKEVEDSRYATNDKVLRAWRLNRSVEAIEEISTDGIECFADMAMAY